MLIDIILPPAEGVQSGDITELLVQEGEVIAKDQGVVEIEAGKATLQVPSTHAGKVSKIHVKAGQTVPTGAILVTIDAEVASSAPPPAPTPSPPRTETAPAPASTSPQSVVPAAHQDSPAPQPTAPLSAPPMTTPMVTAKGSVAVAPQMAPTSAPANDDPNIPAGPAVRRFAREVGVDLRNVKGTGEGSRITREDVLALVRQAAQGAGASANGGKAKRAGGQQDSWGPVHIEKMTRIRRTIAEKMHESWTSVSRVTNFDDADVTELERMRVSSKDDYAKAGIKLTAMPFVIKAVAMALREHPTINASIDMANDQIIYKDYIHIGIAVDTDRGLVVPSLRNADQLSISEIARSLSQISENVRNSRFTVADLQGSTFTISNLGAIGGSYSTPIVNVPEVAILLIGRSREMPVVVNGSIEVRLMMPLSLSYDHRLVDGATAARFLNELMGYLRAPSRLLLAP